MTNEYPDDTLFAEVGEHMNDALGPINFANTALGSAQKIAASWGSPAGNAIDDFQRRVAEVQTLVAELRRDAEEMAATLGKS